MGALDIKQLGSMIEVYLYGSIEGDGYDWFGEKIESETSAKHLREVLDENPNAAQINVFINSPGGSVFEGTAIYNQLKRHKAKKTVYIDGFACSVASIIAMAGDEVIMPKNAMMMVHNPWTFACGNAAELRKQADDLDVITRGNRQAYLEKAGEKLTEEKIIELMDAETWLTAADCIELGLADKYAAQDANMQQSASNLLESVAAKSTIADKLKEYAAPPAELQEETAKELTLMEKLTKLMEG